MTRAGSGAQTLQADVINESGATITINNGSELWLNDSLNNQATIDVAGLLNFLGGSHVLEGAGLAGTGDIKFNDQSRDLLSLKRVSKGLIYDQYSSEVIIIRCFRLK